MRVYLQRLDTHGSRYGSRDVSADGAELAALRTAETAEQLDRYPGPGARARVLLAVALDAGATLPAGSVARDPSVPGDAWHTLASVTNPSGVEATLTVEAESVTAGARPDGGIPAGTITERESAVVGWFEVSNPSPSTRGSYPGGDPSPAGRAGLFGPPRPAFDRPRPPDPRASVLRLELPAIPAEGARHGAACELRRYYPDAPPVDAWHPGAGETPGRWVTGGSPAVGWRVVLPLVRLDAAPLGALVFVDPAALDGELQGSGRAWVPALVSGGGAAARVTVGGGSVALTARAVRVEVSRLPPRARAAAQRGDLARYPVRAALVSGVDGITASLVFALDPGAPIHAVSVSTVADLAPPLWSTREGLTLVESGDTAGEFTAL